jgi:hypothetical protein
LIILYEIIIDVIRKKQYKVPISRRKAKAFQIVQRYTVW